MSPASGPRARTAAPVLAALAALAVLAGCSGAGRPTLSDETAPPLACSADGMDLDGISAEGLTPEVTATRQAIVVAARACDFDALVDLAAAGPLQVTVDGAPMPVTEWERREAEGDPILRPVAGILTLTPAAAAEDGSVTWPSAVDWAFSDVAPTDERDALVGVVGEDGVFGWEDAGGYAGWRTTISGDGTWSTVTLGPAPD